MLLFSNPSVSGPFNAAVVEVVQFEACGDEAGSAFGSSTNAGLFFMTPLAAPFLPRAGVKVFLVLSTLGIGFATVRHSRRLSDWRRNPRSCHGVQRALVSQFPSYLR